MAGQYLLALRVQRVSISTRRLYDGVLRIYITYPYHGNYKIIFENLTRVFLLFNISNSRHTAYSNTYFHNPRG